MPRPELRDLGHARTPAVLRSARLRRDPAGPVRVGRLAARRERRRPSPARATSGPPVPGGGGRLPTVVPDADGGLRRRRHAGRLVRHTPPPSPATSARAAASTRPSASSPTPPPGRRAGPRGVGRRRRGRDDRTRLVAPGRPAPSPGMQEPPRGPGAGRDRTRPSWRGRAAPGAVAVGKPTVQGEGPVDRGRLRREEPRGFGDAVRHGGVGRAWHGCPGHAEDRPDPDTVVAND